MAVGFSGWAADTAVLVKDLAIELRTRYALAAIGLFAVTCLVAVSFTAGPQPQPTVQAALLWLILLFSAFSGLARSFVAEEDARTADALRLAASPQTVYLGKLAFNGVLLAALLALLVPGYTLLMAVEWTSPGLLVATLVCGCWGLAAVLTFTSGLIARARARGVLGPVVAFPLLIPLLFAAIRCTAAAAGAPEDGWGQLRALIAFAGIMTTVAVLLFDLVWNA